MLNLDHYQVILGSQSPRRKELLQHLNINFKQEVRSIDETYPNDILIEDIAVFLAQQKGKAFIEDIQPNHLVITADTIVSIDNKVLEKATNTDHARQMIQSLSGKTHTVYSGVAITTASGQTCFQDATKVFFKTLEKDEIEYYIKHYQPFDKAGAYGIQEWIGHIGIQKIEGSFYSVMGLPLHLLYEALRKYSK